MTNPTEAAKAVTAPVPARKYDSLAPRFEVSGFIIANPRKGMLVRRKYQDGN